MEDLRDRVALVTGGAGGIGKAACQHLAERGAIVIVADLDVETNRCAAQAGEWHFAGLDVTSEQDWKRVVDATLQQHHRIDVLVNAAGIVGDVVHGTLEQTSIDEWRRVLAVNLDGTFLGCREIMRAMKVSGTGSIINISSVGAYYPTTQSVAYGASKGAVTQLTKTVALYGAQDGNRIRCNSVHPGRTATSMLNA